MSDPASLVSPAPPGGQPSARRVMSVLLVEDDRSDARLLTEFLRRSRFFDHAITAAGDQDAAIALSREKPFDLVILDYWLRTQASLPLSPGWSAAFPAVPILLVTSVDAADIQSLALSCGASGYLHKNDLSHSALDAVIRTLLHARQSEQRLRASLSLRQPGAGRLRENMDELSHEALSTLKAAHGFAQILSTDSRDIVPGADTSGYIDLIKQGSETLIDILHSCLARAESSNGAPKLQFQHEDIGKIIKSVALTVQHHCNARGHALLVSTIGGPVHAEVDKTAVYQMLLNLLANAVKYSPRETTISLVLTDLGDRFKISLSGQDIGISPQEAPCALQRYARDAAPAEVSAPGDGPGLAMVSSIVEMHGGELLIDSIMGGGATVHVTLPVRRARLN